MAILHARPASPKSRLLLRVGFSFLPVCLGDLDSLACEVCTVGQIRVGFALPSRYLGDLTLSSPAIPKSLFRFQVGFALLPRYLVDLKFLRARFKPHVLFLVGFALP